MSANNTDQVLYEANRPETKMHPIFWKRWTVSMLAVYPPLVCLVLASQFVLGDVPLLISLFIIAFCLTGLSTGFILPFLNRQLHGWLHR